MCVLTITRTEPRLQFIRRRRHPRSRSYLTYLCSFSLPLTSLSLSLPFFSLVSLRNFRECREQTRVASAERVCRGDPLRAGRARRVIQISAKRKANDFPRAVFLAETALGAQRRKSYCFLTSARDSSALITGVPFISSRGEARGCTIIRGE